MSDKPTVTELLEVQKYFDLPSPALVEKDWFVMRALAAITRADTGDFRLVFSGGTALSRAYRLIHRMSEDIDLKIVSDKPMSRPGLRRLRETIAEALLEAGFQFDASNAHHLEAGNASRYALFRLPYEPIAEVQQSLRPEIQVEMAVWPLRMPALECPLISFVAEAFKNQPEVPAITCASIAEIVAEKFVALTRRAGAEWANAGGPRDPTLVRHIYDLHVVSGHYDPTEVIELAQAIMLADVKAYGHQFPAYRNDPIAATQLAVAGLAAEAGFAKRYSAFLRDMVYGADQPDFEIALATIRELSKLLKR